MTLFFEIVYRYPVLVPISSKHYRVLERLFQIFLIACAFNMQAKINIHQLRAHYWISVKVTSMITLTRCFPVWIYLSVTTRSRTKSTLLYRISDTPTQMLYLSSVFHNMLFRIFKIVIYKASIGFFFLLMSA